jgi:hypothetical protein
MTLKVSRKAIFRKGKRNIGRTKVKISLQFHLIHFMDNLEK